MTEIRCTRWERDEDFQRYLGGGMTAADQEAFEQHYFECGDCCEALENHRAIRAAVLDDRTLMAPLWIRQTPRRVVWAGVAIAVVLTIGISVVRRPPTGIHSPGGAQPNAAREGASQARAQALSQLARFDPPSYRPVTSRGADADMERAFRTAMTSYQAGDFATAARQLRAAGNGARLEETKFFLGISELQIGEVDAGIADLRSVVGLGDTAYLEEAAFFLAKALLGRSDVTGARQLLEMLVDTRGDRAADAGRLLESVGQLPQP